MSEPLVPQSPAPASAPQPPAPPATAAPTLEGLHNSVRTMRIWLIVLTVVLGLSLSVAVWGVSAAMLGLSGIIDEATGPTSEAVDETKSTVREAYGDRLDSLEVRVVTVDYGAPFPFSIMEGELENSLYVEYTLKGSDVVVADVANEMFGEDVESSGILPTAGSLKDRMSIEQLEKLLDAYREETKEPLGAVHRYGTLDYIDSGEPGPDQLTVAGKTYKTDEVWSAMEGKIVEGDKLKMDDMEDGRKALIFHEDPKTGAFNYLGTEPADYYW